MTTSYIYSTSRVNTLQSQLLSSTQVERMVSARTVEEAYNALNDTFLASYIAGGKLEDLPRALRKSLSATKRLIAQIAPEPEILDVLWLKYDFYNLAVIVKGLRVGLSDDDLRENCFFVGSLEVDKIIGVIRSEQLRDLNTPTIKFSEVLEQMQNAQNVYEIDRIANRAYFATVIDIAQKVAKKHPFVADYVRLIIDLYNVRTQLRLMSVPQFASVDRREIWVDGGVLVFTNCQSVDDCVTSLERISGVSPITALWRDAVDTIVKEGNFAQLERLADDFVVDFVKKSGATILSIAPLFAYFLAHRNNTQIVKTIITGKQSGMSDVNLRKILRKLYI